MSIGGNRFIEKQHGKWKGKQIATTQSWEFANHGLLWWLYEDPDGYGTRVYLHTNMYVFPKLDLVIVRIQNRSNQGFSLYEPKAFELFNKYILK